MPAQQQASKCKETTCLACRSKHWQGSLRPGHWRPVPGCLLFSRAALDDARCPDSVLVPGRQWLPVNLLVCHTVRRQATGSLVVQLIAGTANARTQNGIVKIGLIKLRVDIMQSTCAPNHTAQSKGGSGSVHCIMQQALQVKAADVGSAVLPQQEWVPCKSTEDPAWLTAKTPAAGQ